MMLFNSILLSMFIFSAVHTFTVGALPLSRRSFDADETVLLERRSEAIRCTELTLDALEALPGWPALQQHVRSIWGTGDWEVEVNVPGYKDKPATVCVADSLPVNVTGKAHCNSTRVEISPKKGSHTIQVNHGYTNVGFWNLTNLTDVAHAKFFTANLQMPNLTKAITGRSYLKAIQGSGVFVNAPFNNFQTRASNVTVKDVTLTTVQDKHCLGTIRQDRCIIPAAGRIQFVASGYVWFKYKTKRAALANPKGPKHRRYAVKIEEVLRNATDRSVYSDFTGYMNTTVRYDYFDECRWNFQL